MVPDPFVLVNLCLVLDLCGLGELPMGLVTDVTALIVLAITFPFAEILLAVKFVML